MNLFNEIRSLIAKPSREFKKIYTQTDEIYIIWYTGYAIGECSLEAEKIKHTGVFNPVDLNDKLMQLQAAYHKLIAQTSAVSEDNILDKNFINQIYQFNQDRNQIPSLLKHLSTLQELLVMEIKAYSTHLANIFLFGFQLMKLKNTFLFERHPNKINKELDVMEDIISHIDKGDKTLNSPNLELVPENLNVISVSLSLIRRNLENLAILKHKDPGRYNKKVDQCFAIWEDIILDIKNPDEMIKSRFYVVVAYYYFLIIVLGSIQVLYTEVLKEPISDISGDQFMTAQTADYLLKVLVIPALLWLFVYMYRLIKRKITGYLLRRRFYKILNK